MVKRIIYIEAFKKSEFFLWCVNILLYIYDFFFVDFCLLLLVVAANAGADADIDIYIYIYTCVLLISYWRELLGNSIHSLWFKDIIFIWKDRFLAVFDDPEMGKDGYCLIQW